MRRSRSALTAIAALAALIVVPAPRAAGATLSGESPSAALSAIANVALPGAVESVLGEEVRRLGSGLYKVSIARGPALLTHGPDPEPALAPSDPDVVFGGGAPERRPVCASDHYQHVLYGRTPDGPDRYGEVGPVIRRAIHRMNALLNADSLASGGPSADYKVLCGPSGAIRIDSFISASPRFDDVVAAARAAGFNQPHADYTIFFDGSVDEACGVGSYSADQRLIPDNANNSGGGYAISYAGCWSGGVAMHENGHNQGAVPGTGAEPRPCAALLAPRAGPGPRPLRAPQRQAQSRALPLPLRELGLG